MKGHCAHIEGFTSMITQTAKFVPNSHNQYMPIEYAVVVAEGEKYELRLVTGLGGDHLARMCSWNFSNATASVSLLIHALLRSGCK